MAKTKNIWERIQNVDRRYIFLLTAIVFIPLLYPLAIPFKPSPYAVDFYNAVEAVPDGSYVLAMNQFGPDDLEKMWAKRALTDRLLKKNCKIVEASVSATAPIAVQRCWNDLVDKSVLATKKYGVDYVFLPYVAGEVVAWSAVGRDIRAATGGVDYFGTKFDSLPIMTGINNGGHFQFLTETGHHTSLAIEPVVTQIQAVWGMPLVVISAGISHALTANFIATGNIKAALEGLTDMAGYELLVKDPGLNLKQMDVVSFHHIMLIALIIVGNVVYLLSKTKKSEVEK